MIEELVQHTPTAFPAVAGVDVLEMYDDILEEWALGHGPCPPTWAELFRLLREMGLSELAGRMEKYLRGPEDPPRPPLDEEDDDLEEQKDGEQINYSCFVFMLEVPQMKHQSKKISG